MRAAASVLPLPQRLHPHTVPVSRWCKGDNSRMARRLGKTACCLRGCSFGGAGLLEQFDSSRVEAAREAAAVVFRIALIGVDPDPRAPAQRLLDVPDTTQIVLHVPAHLDLDGRITRRQQPFQLDLKRCRFGLVENGEQRHGCGTRVERGGACRHFRSGRNVPVAPGEIPAPDRVGGIEADVGEQKRRKSD